MINVAGVISISLFYILILGVGIWAGRKKEEGNDSEEEVMLAGRSIGLFVGIFTMTGNEHSVIFTSNIFTHLLPCHSNLQQHGSAVATSTERQKQFTLQDWSGVKRHSAMHWAWCLVSLLELHNSKLHRD